VSVIVEAARFPTAHPKLPRVDPCTITIFGATGDLSKRKLIPALLRLAGAGCLGNLTVLGVGRQPMSDDKFRAMVREAVAKDGRDFDETEWSEFAARLHYLSGDLTDSETYHRIASRRGGLRSETGKPDNHLFYFATPPSVAADIVNGLGEAGLAAEEQGWSRIVVEKPFGYDLQSARALNEVIGKTFQEHQVYRIDHYLGKETVQNIIVFRFGNALFEPVWNRNCVDYIEITAAETIGIGDRAGYYEEVGALRDMVANHLLQLVTLTAMGPPVEFDADSVRDEKVRVLRSIHPMTPEEVAQQTVRGQYGPGNIDGKKVAGYRDERGVAKDSLIETYAEVEFRIENWRWSGVPFYARTGKRLSRSLTEIAVHFKRTPQALFARRSDDQIEPNVIVLRIQPDEGIVVTFGAKRPGAEMHTSTVQMDFCYQKSFGVRLPAAYETLLLDVMQGDATLFIRRDEIEAQWKLITPILEAWSHQRPPEFPNYAAGSEGPGEADSLPARNGHSWRPIGESISGCDEEPKSLVQVK
jgi:glucose-6-phosphate 1-dehydrogenase